MLRFLALGSIIADLPRSRSKFSSCFKIFSMSLKDFLEVEIQIDRIHVNNGTYYLNGCFCAEKEFCVSRLPVAYIPDAAPPKQWLSFLEQLLEPPDIITLQEYISELLRAPRCSFVLYVGRKKLVKRVEFERFISESIEI